MPPVIIQKKGFIESNGKTVERFLRAVYRGYRFLLNANVTDIAKSLKPSFNSISDASIVTSINSYIECDAWVSSPVMQESAFDKLQDIIIAAGELDAKVNFNDVVETTIAKRVVEYFK